MRATFTILSLAFAAGNALTLEAPIPGYGIEEFQWEVQAFIDGPKMNLSGTIERVYAQLIELNPNFDDDFKIDDNQQEPEESAEQLQKRFGPVCGGGSYGWSGANFDAILGGITYLRTVAGSPTNGPGPGNCGRVSCGYDAAIWWCNDNNYPFSLPSYSTIADCADVLSEHCTYWSDHRVYTLGQNFNGYNWNCIVRYDPC